MNASGLVARYREIKHGLGNLFFEPELALAIQEANLALKARIQKLYGQEERRIVAEYQRVFELEREVPLDGDLDGELSQFRLKRLWEMPWREKPERWIKWLHRR